MSRCCQVGPWCTSVHSSHTHTNSTALKKSDWDSRKYPQGKLPESKATDGCCLQMLQENRGGGLEMESRGGWGGWWAEKNKVWKNKFREAGSALGLTFPLCPALALGLRTDFRSSLSLSLSTREIVIIIAGPPTASEGYNMDERL